MGLQWRGYCCHCGEPKFNERDLVGIKSKTMPADIWQVYLIRDDNNKTVVSLCEKCYSLDKLDYEKIRDNLYASEKDFAKAKGSKELEEFAEGFKNLVFVSHTKNR